MLSFTVGIEREMQGDWNSHGRRPLCPLTQELLASDSSDLLMNDMALRKEDTHNAFVNKELGAGAG